MKCKKMVNAMKNISLTDVTASDRERRWPRLSSQKTGHRG